MSETGRKTFRLPGMPDIAEVERVLAEVQAGTLPPEQQAEKVQFLQESVVAIGKALPSVEQLQALTTGIEQLVNDVKTGKFKKEGGEAQATE